MDVVTNGPVAIAGSIFNLSIKMGTIDPKKTEIIIAKQIDNPTIIPRLNEISKSMNLK